MAVAALCAATATTLFSPLPPKKNRVSRPTPGVRTETCARQELRAEIAAMMSGEQLGIAQEPRYRTAYVNSWTKRAEERTCWRTRAATVDAQRMSDWLLGAGRRPYASQCPHNHVRSRTTRRPDTECARA